jgi:hypothetical protein
VEGPACHAQLTRGWQLERTFIVQTLSPKSSVKLSPSRATSLSKERPEVLATLRRLLADSLGSSAATALPESERQSLKSGVWPDQE